MRIAVYQHCLRHAAKHLDAFATGLERHGHRVVRVPLGRQPVACDLAVVWGIMRKDVIAAQRLSGRRFVVLERGYVGNRARWISAGYDGLNGRADFCNAGSSDERFRQHFGGLLEPWKTGGEYVLMMGQCRHDQSVRHVDMATRMADVVRAIRSRSQLPIRFRPHPEDADAPAPSGSSPIAGTLHEVLSRAHSVVTLNSNSGVDAALAGVPVVALDRGSMAWPVAGHRSHEAIRPTRPDRTPWAAGLAWCQWTDHEMAQGDCWAHLKRGLHRRSQLARS